MGKSQPIDLALYNRLKAKVKKRVKRWPSAYASGQLVRLYKRAGGRYRTVSKFGDLKRWFEERWTDVCTGKPCGRKKGENRKYPYCRPTRRINGSTPRTRQQMSSTQIKRMCAKKRLYKKKTITQFGKSKAANLLDLTDNKSILNLRKQIKAKIINKRTWIYFISKPVTDLKNIKFTLKRKSMKTINNKLGQEFNEYIKRSSGSVTSFYSPSGTLLVIPTKGYINITDFALNCTQQEWISLWRRVLKESKKIPKPFYILTHGHSVNWLHIRLQKRKGFGFGFGFGGKANDNRTSTGIPNPYYQGNDVHVYYIDTSDDYSPVHGKPFKLHFTYGGRYKYTGNPNYTIGPHITYEPGDSSGKIHWSPSNPDPGFYRLPLQRQELIKKHFFRIFDNGGENMDIPYDRTPYKVPRRLFDQHSGPYLSGSHVPSVTRKRGRPPSSPISPLDSVRKKLFETSLGPRKRLFLPR